MSSAIRLPEHVAIIMDGNGRWAKARHMPRSAGHLAGVENVRRAVRHARGLGLKHLTLFAFSSENWQRPVQEVGYLLRLLRAYIRRDVEELKRDNVRLRVIGSREGLDKSLVDLLENAMQDTASNDGLQLTVAFNYGARQEIVDATKQIAEAVRDGKLPLEAINTDMFGNFLYSSGLPDPDLLIRTSGEIRISNFLLWQCAYAEFVFVPECWPDFTTDVFDRALAEYASRDRRFGRVKQAENA